MEKNFEHHTVACIGVATYVKVGGGATHTRERSHQVGEGVGGVSPSHGVENFSFSRTLK